MKDPLQTLKTVYSEYGQFCQRRGRISEADTRAILIDRLLYDVLEWPKTSVQREVHSSTVGYLDYELSTTRPVLVIEAKASGESFEIPFRKSRLAVRLKISGVLRSNAALQAALIQAQRYCSDRGIRYGVATNAYSFVIFRAIVDGAPWKDNEAI